MIITYGRCSKPSAERIAEKGGFRLNRGPSGDINWGRANANTLLNPNISNSTNKRRMRQLFAENNVPMPYLYTPTQTSRLASTIFPLVGRPDRHTGGRGFWLCRNQADVRRALQGTRRKRAATHFMEYIDAPYELRVHVFKGKSIRISQKAFGTSGITAHGCYTTIKPVCDVRQARKAAKQAVEALGLDFGAVDVLVTEDGTPYVTEVNAAPGIGGSLPQLYADVFMQWKRGEWFE